MPGLLTWPETQNNRVPPFLGDPRPAYHSPPRRGKRLDVVNHRRRSVEADDSRERRANAGIAALAFERFHQRRFFSAFVGARAGVRDHIEIKSAAEDVLAQVACLVGFRERFVHDVQDVAILTADVNISLVRAHRAAGDYDSLD